MAVPSAYAGTLSYDFSGVRSSPVGPFQEGSASSGGALWDDATLSGDVVLSDLWITMPPAARFTIGLLPDPQVSRAVAHFGARGSF
jgi:hypothetical protein